MDVNLDKKIYVHVHGATPSFIGVARQQQQSDHWRANIISILNSIHVPTSISFIHSLSAIAITPLHLHTLCATARMPKKKDEEQVCHAK